MSEDASITQDLSKEDLEFERWKEEFMKLPDKEKGRVLLDKAKEQMSDIDKQVIDDILLLLEENQDKHTDLLWINEQLEKKYPDINPLAIMSYFFVLKTCGIIDLDNK